MADRKTKPGRARRPKTAFHVNAVPKQTPDLHLLAQVILNAAVKRADAPPPDQPPTTRTDARTGR